MSRNTKWLIAFFGLMITTAAMALTVNGELKKALFEKLSADPTGYTARVYYNTTSNKTRIYDGTSWSDIGGATSSLNEFLIDVGSAGNTRTTANTNLLGDAKASSISATATITIASPGVVTIVGHGLTTGNKIYFTTTGALPTGLTASTTYYVIAVDASTFRLATSMTNAFAGTAINTSGSQSGVHTAFYGGIALHSEIAGTKTLHNSLTIGNDSVASSRMLDIRSGSAQRATVNLYQGGTSKGTISTANSSNDLAPGTTAGDLVFRSENGSDMFFTADSGVTTHARINTDGSMILGATDSKVTVGGYANASAWIGAGADQTAGTCAPNCTISADYGDMLDTVTRSGTGTYTINFTPSYWSAGPVCQANCTRGSSHICVLNSSALSTSSYSVACFTDAGAAVDTRFTVSCQGPR